MQVGKQAIVQAPVVVQMQQAAVGTVGRRCLGDKFVGQIVIELRKVQVRGHVENSKVAAPCARS